MQKAQNAYDDTKRSSIALSTNDETSVDDQRNTAVVRVRVDGNGPRARQLRKRLLGVSS
jgi:hypothetical protein